MIKSILAVFIIFGFFMLLLSSIHKTSDADLYRVAKKVAFISACAMITIMFFFVYVNVF